MYTSGCPKNQNKCSNKILTKTIENISNIAKFNGAYWFRTTCRDGTENTISSGTTLEDYEVIDRLSPCTKKQMSNDPIWYDNPDYFDELENNSGPEL